LFVRSTVWGEKKHDITRRGVRQRVRRKGRAKEVDWGCSEKSRETIVENDGGTSQTFTAPDSTGSAGS